ncbi:hypothetical protein M8D54_004159 [Salmonella enterica]|uniref:Uncharacterized protein n=1 Tax=Salmonella enterica TaxID=28901 RepID=A0A629K764_SALER|nr:hypothetical protein [Salmonella enterica]EGR6192259.1 hypothetical protein [Salmonella enterica]EHR7427394.1 hypothetical protein [Salmonella enterica]EJF2004513.1 hypothetical protein [Salmonella enterica]EJF2492343.1 hypothetical protein [Salmonella enterica]
MTKTLNPTITVTVSGPTGSGKSRVLAVIADVLKLIHGDCIIEAPDVKAEKEMCGDDYTTWHKPRSGTILKLEEVNLPINTGRCITTPIIAEDLYDRPVPVHIQALMSKLGISFEEFKETDLQPVVDLVNWALTTPKLPETPTEEAQNKKPSTTEIRKYMVNELVDAMSPENCTWHLPDAIHAVIAALFVLYDQELVSMELCKKKLIGRHANELDKTK